MTIGAGAGTIQPPMHGQRQVAGTRQEACAGLDSRKSCSFVVLGMRFDLGVGGRLTRVSGAAESAEVRVPLAGRHQIEKVFLADVQGDVLIVYETADDETGAGAIIRVQTVPLRLKWHLPIPAFNISLGTIEGGHLYQAAIGLVSAVDLERGVFVWEHKRLYDRERSSFNAFERPEVEADAVVFRESSPLSGKPRIIRVDKSTGAFRIEGGV